MDGFDQLPDSLILLIFNSVSDIKTLMRCRSVSKRFNSLVPQAESLSLKVDRVISPESDSDSLLLTFFKIFLKSLHDLLTNPTKSINPIRTPTQNSPTHILSQFHRVKNLQIELPVADLKLDKGIRVKWQAYFGKSLKSCVIIGFKSGSTTDGENLGEGGGVDIAGGLKTRVMWTISALIAASARHYMLEEVVKEHEEMERLVLVDREGEGTVVMDKQGMRECRLEATHVSEEWGRTMVPSVRMRMRHKTRLVLTGGVRVEGATLVVVRASGGGAAATGAGSGGNDDVEDGELALGSFGHTRTDNWIYRAVAQELLKSRGYTLEMNSF